MILSWVGADGEEWDLTDENGVDVIAGTAGLDAPPRTLNLASRVTHGASLVAARYEPRVVTLALDVIDETVDLEARWIVADMAERFEGPGVLRYYGEERFRDLVSVYYESGLAGEEREVPYWQRVVLSLVALDPFWYDPAESITLYAPEVNDEYNAALPYDSPLPYESDGGISVGRGYNEDLVYDAPLTYDGGAVVMPSVQSGLGAWPTITFTGPATWAQVLHLRTGEIIQFADDFALAATTLVVNTDPLVRAVTLNGTPAWDALSLGSSPELELLPGDQLSVLMTGTTAESKIDITWRQRWRTP